MEFANIKNHLRKPTQYICVQVSYRSRTSANQVLLDDVKYWLEDILSEKGEVHLDSDGFFRGPHLIKCCTGTKEDCKRVQAEERFHRQAYGSTSRLIQLGMWRDSWLILPADENGNWVPTMSMIKKAYLLLGNILG